MIALREPGAILLVSCYELGHQPHGLAFPMAFLERQGFAPGALDLAVEPLDEAERRRLVDSNTTEDLRPASGLPQG